MGLDVDFRRIAKAALDDVTKNSLHENPCLGTYQDVIELSHFDTTIIGENLRRNYYARDLVGEILFDGVEKIHSLEVYHISPEKFKLLYARVKQHLDNPTDDLCLDDVVDLGTVCELIDKNVNFENEIIVFHYCQ